MSSIKCQSCGLVNFEASAICKRCNANLGRMPNVKPEKNLEDEAFLRRWGLQEFEVLDSEPVTLSKLPFHLGVIGCIKLVIMITTIIFCSIYGGKLILYILPEWFSTRLKYAIGLIILFVPIIFSPFLAVRFTDRVFRLLRLSK
jgi:hypothetical protein